MNKELNDILSFIHINFSDFLVNVVTFIMGLLAILSLVEKLAEKCGIELKWMRKKREDHELLIKTSMNLEELQKKHREDVSESIRHDDMIRHDLEKLTSMFIDKSVDDMRWEIINFASNVSEGKPCNKDSYKHCLHIYEKYEKIIEENGLTNGEVELSMEIIHQSYKDKLKNGF